MEEFRVCESCGYERGFHVFFRREGEAMKIGLICPQCGRSYEIGWETGAVSISKPAKGPVYG